MLKLPTWGGRGKKVGENCKRILCMAQERDNIVCIWFQPVAMLIDSTKLQVDRVFDATCQKKCFYYPKGAFPNYIPVHSGTSSSVPFH